MEHRGAVSLVSTLTFAAIPVAVRWAREHVASALRAWEIGGDMVNVAKLLTSELVTNAARVSSPDSVQRRPCTPEASERISLTLRLLPGRVVIEVSDNDPNPPVVADPGPDSESGRGLMLVQALSKEWGYQYPPSGGKVVFAALCAELPDLGSRQ